MKEDMINIEYAITASKLKYPSLCVIDTLINLYDVQFLGCRNCIFREAVDERNIICPHRVIANGDDVIK